MNYDKYYKKCKKNYKGKIKDTDFYNNPVRVIPKTYFSEQYFSTIDEVSKKIKNYFDNLEDEEIMVYHNNIWEFEDDLNIISKELVSWLEENFYNCHLYVDKVYIYRTKQLEEREASYIWHYDNNPQELIKNIIYLNEVTELNSPFEFLTNEKGLGVLYETKRKGTRLWKSVEGRLDDLVNELISKGTHSPFKLTGPQGTTCGFSNDIIHRANPVIEGYRDVINIRVHPCINKPPHLLDPKWTTSREVSGVANKDPEITWEQLI